MGMYMKGMSERSAIPGASGGAVRVRFAPSPTGPLHIGSARTALFNWLFARRRGGVFILRIEDTDAARSKEEFEKDIIDGLSWLGLGWDEGPFRQSERGAHYRKYLEELLAKGDAYYCYCTKEELEAQREALLSQGLPPRYGGRCRSLAAPPEGQAPQAIRFKVPATKVEFNDMIRGKVSFDASLFGDIVIAKNLAAPLYNFTVVVDDALMEITHVIRGEDHLSNTPKQILFQRALGFAEPIYAHIPLILNADRSKMSKRFSDTALLSYRRRGYLPAAVVNFLAFLGWHPKGDREVWPADELAKAFDLAGVQAAGAVFDEQKLNWLNREYMKTMPDEEIVRALGPFFARARLGGGAGQGSGGSAGGAMPSSGKLFAERTDDPEFLRKFVAVERSRADTLADFLEHGKFFFALPDYDAALLVPQGGLREEARAALAAAADALAGIDGREFTREAVAAAVTDVITATGGKRGAVLWPLRTALSGLRASPGPVEIMDVLGKEESLRRVRKALDVV